MTTADAHPIALTYSLPSQQPDHQLQRCILYCLSKVTNLDRYHRVTENRFTNCQPTQLIVACALYPEAWNVQTSDVINLFTCADEFRRINAQLFREHSGYFHEGEERSSTSLSRFDCENQLCVSQKVTVRAMSVPMKSRH
jgi:hypothetical protein